MKAVETVLYLRFSLTKEKSTYWQVHHSESTPPEPSITRIPSRKTPWLQAVSRNISPPRPGSGTSGLFCLHRYDIPCCPLSSIPMPYWLWFRYLLSSYGRLLSLRVSTSLWGLRIDCKPQCLGPTASSKPFEWNLLGLRTWWGLVWTAPSTFYHGVGKEETQFSSLPPHCANFGQAWPAHLQNQTPRVLFSHTSTIILLVFWLPPFPNIFAYYFPAAYPQPTSYIPNLLF